MIFHLTAVGCTYLSYYELCNGTVRPCAHCYDRAVRTVNTMQVAFISKKMAINKFTVTVSSIHRTNDSKILENTYFNNRKIIY